MARIGRGVTGAMNSMPTKRVAPNTGNPGAENKANMKGALGGRDSGQLAKAVGHCMSSKTCAPEHEPLGGMQPSAKHHD